MFKGLRVLIGLGILALFLWVQYRRGAFDKLERSLSGSAATAAVRVAQMDSAALAADAGLGTSLQALQLGRLSEQVLIVTKVVDGDTYELRLLDGKQVRVRLIGVDTPEKYITEKLREEARRAGVSETRVRTWGRRASALGRRLARGRRVRLEYDPAYARREHRGYYGRLLAYVWVLGPEDSPEYLLNEALLRRGYGRATEAPRYGGRFKRAELAARRRGDGLFRGHVRLRESAGGDAEPERSGQRPRSGRPGRRQVGRPR